MAKRRQRHGVLERARSMGDVARRMPTRKKAGQSKTFSDRSRLLPIRLEPEDYAALRVAAAEKGQAMSVLVRRLIQDELRKQVGAFLEA